MEFVLGKDCKAYYGAADATLQTLTELSCVKDGTVDCETGTADVSTRACGGWKATAATLRDMSVELDLVYKPGDAGYKALRDAWLNGTQVCLALLTGAKVVAGSEGPHGNFSVTKFSRGEPLEEGVSVKATAKLTKFIAWIEVAAP
jgi:predicted secreted protein